MRLGGGGIPFPKNIATITMQFTRLFLIVPMLLYIGLWCVKLAFLLFFKRLGTRSVRGVGRWWWVVMVITILCFGICYATLPYRCCLVSFAVVVSKDCQTQGWSFISMKINCGLDVGTDVLSTYEAL
jgi:hypothetical protein